MKPNSSEEAAPASAAASTPSHGAQRAQDVADRSSVTAKPVDGAEQHHALDAEIEHAAFLDHQFAGGGEQDRRRDADDGQERVDEKIEHQATASAGAARGASRMMRSRQRTSTSLARMKNSIIAWKMPAVALGHMHRRLRHLPADIGDREHEPGEHDADGMQPAEERDDDRGEAIAGGEAEVELPELARRLEHAGEPRHRARDQQRRPDRAEARSRRSAPPSAPRRRRAPQSHIPSAP